MNSSLVLVVDDDRDTRDLYRLVFELAGFRVADAESCATALEQAKRLKPDVIVTDWMLGDGDGHALCQGLRRHGRTRLIPVVAATGMTLGDPLRAAARRLGCEAFLTKPIDVDVLVRTTADAIQAKQARVLRAAAASVRRKAVHRRRCATENAIPRALSAAELIAPARTRARDSVALIIADDAGRYVAVNHRAAELTGYDPAVLTTLSVADLTPDPQVLAGHGLWHRFIESGAQEGVYLVKRRDGAAVPLRYVAVANIAPGLHLSALSPAASGTPQPLVA